MAAAVISGKVISENEKAKGIISNPSSMIATTNALATQEVIDIILDYATGDKLTQLLGSTSADPETNFINQLITRINNNLAEFEMILDDNTPNQRRFNETIQLLETMFSTTPTSGAGAMPAPPAAGADTTAAPAEGTIETLIAKASTAANGDEMLARLSFPGRVRAILHYGNHSDLSTLPAKEQAFIAALVKNYDASLLLSKDSLFSLEGTLDGIKAGFPTIPATEQARALLSNVLTESIKQIKEHLKAIEATKASMPAAIAATARPAAVAATPIAGAGATTASTTRTNRAPITARASSRTAGAGAGATSASSHAATIDIITTSLTGTKITASKDTKNLVYNFLEKPIKTEINQIIEDTDFGPEEYGNAIANLDITSKVRAILHYQGEDLSSLSENEKIFVAALLNDYNEAGNQDAYKEAFEILQDSRGDSRLQAVLNPEEITKLSDPTALEDSIEHIKAFFVAEEAAAAAPLAPTPAAHAAAAVAGAPAPGIASAASAASRAGGIMPSSPGTGTPAMAGSPIANDIYYNTQSTIISQYIQRLTAAKTANNNPELEMLKTYLIDYITNRIMREIQTHPDLLDPKSQIPNRLNLMLTLRQLGEQLAEIDPAFKTGYDAIANPLIEQLQKAENIAKIIASLSLNTDPTTATLGAGHAFTEEDMQTLLHTINTANTTSNTTTVVKRSDTNNVMNFSIYYDPGKTKAVLRTTSAATATPSVAESLDKLLGAKPNTNKIADFEINKETGQLSLSFKTDLNPSEAKVALAVLKEKLVDPLVEKATKDGTKISVDAIPDGPARALLAQALAEAAFENPAFTGFSNIKNNMIGQEFTQRLVAQYVQQCSGSMTPGQEDHLKNLFDSCPTEIQKLVIDSIAQIKSNAAADDESDNEAADAGDSSSHASDPRGGPAASSRHSAPRGGARHSGTAPAGSGPTASIPPAVEQFLRGSLNEEQLKKVKQQLRKNPASIEAIKKSMRALGIDPATGTPFRAAAGQGAAGSGTPTPKNG